MSAHASADWDQHPCSNPIEHRPHPLRTVEHHVQPEAAGGKDGPRVWLCDNCHYDVHRLMWYSRIQRRWPRVGKYLHDLAQRGVQLCIEAGTLHSIPNEG